MTSLRIAAIATAILVARPLSFAQPPAPPAPQDELDVKVLPTEPSPDEISDAERNRIEAMFSQFAGKKLKGVKIDERFRRRLIRDEADEGVVGDDASSPHEFGFHAALPDDPKAFTVQVPSAQAVGPKRYKIVVQVTIPIRNIGGFYKFDGTRGILGEPVGWAADDVNADVEVIAVLDIAWKNMENGNIGIYPGGFLDDSLTEEERKASRLIEGLEIQIARLDLSRLNLDGINGRRAFIRNGRTVGNGLFAKVLGGNQELQLEEAIEGGINNAIRSNEPQLLAGINDSIQSELPETQLVITNFIEKLAIQANLPGKKETPTEKKTPEKKEEIDPFSLFKSQ